MTVFLVPLSRSLLLALSFLHSLSVSLHSSLKSLALGLKLKLKLIVINGLLGFEDKGPGPRSIQGNPRWRWPDDFVWERSPMGQWAGRQRALQALPWLASAV
jgi:hypothetical protein